MSRRLDGTVSCFLVLAFFLAAATPVAAQAAEYPGCSESPETCTPRGVNQGVRTGNETVTTILYAHLADLLGHKIVTTQPPHPDHEVDLDGGWTTPTAYVDHEDAPCCKFKTSEFHLHYTPHAVEYKNSRMQFGHEQWFHGPTEVVDDVVGYVYLSARSTPDAVPTPPGGPGVMPAVGVYMRMETGRDAWNGALIAEGDTGMGYRSPDPERRDETTTMISRPGEDAVYEFAVRMPLTQDSWAFSTDDYGFVVTMVIYQVDVEGVAEFTSADWRIRTGPEFPPRLHLTTTPTLVDGGLTVAANIPPGQLYTTWSLWSAWGTYDTDIETFEFRMTGSDGEDVAVDPLRIRWPYNAHGLIEPMNVTWKTSETADDLPDGAYRLSASVMNLQGTYRLERNATILIEDGVPRLAADGETLTADEDAPAAGAAVVAAALIGALLLGRPRRHSGKP